MLLPKNEENKKKCEENMRRMCNTVLLMVILLSNTSSGEKLNGNNNFNGNTTSNVEEKENIIATTLKLYNGNESIPEKGVAQELKYERHNKWRRPYNRHPIKKLITTSENIASLDPQRGPTSQECTYFTKTVCLKSTNYPLNSIMKSIRNNREMLTALLTDYNINEAISSQDIPELINSEENDIKERKYQTNVNINQSKRRSYFSIDKTEESVTCPSQVIYARPQLARAASGIWKYIINTGEHTQTLRLEKCSKPQSACSYISENYRSSCLQIYNYHRLLTWDSLIGLHMDIFKVPTCCSCHVSGYAELYPPHQNDPPSKPQENFPGADFSVTDQKANFQENINYYSFANKHSPDFNFEISFDVPKTLPKKSIISDKHFPVVTSHKPLINGTKHRSSYSILGRRYKKANSNLRPNKNLPVHHAPNTRAPGFKGSLSKNTRINKINRTYKRALNAKHKENDSLQSYRNESKAILETKKISVANKPNENFVEDLREHQTKINYNYHPIIDFFIPHTSTLQSVEIRKL